MAGMDELEFCLPTAEVLIAADPYVERPPKSLCYAVELTGIKAKNFVHRGGRQ